MFDIFRNYKLDGIECPICSCDNHLVLECEIDAHAPTADPQLFKNVWDVYCEECDSRFTMTEYYRITESYLNFEIKDTQTNSNYGEGDFA